MLFLGHLLGHIVSVNMPKSITRTYSAYSCEAAQLMGGLIRVARIARNQTAQELAERAHISRGLLQRIEKGDMKCEIGVVFEVAALLGIELFDVERRGLSRHLRHTEDTLSLLPKAVRKTVKVVDDDF